MFKTPAPILDARLRFPDPRQARPDGLVALGGDLSTARLLLAYSSGIFPWTVAPLTWWSPDPRGIFELNQFHVARSLARVIRRGVFETTVDHAFLQVMEGCAEAGPGRRSTWITCKKARSIVVSKTPRRITRARLREIGRAHV